MRRELDEFDEAIIAALQSDGRSSLRSIASAVGLSPDAVGNRISRLTGDALLKVVGVVDPRSVGINAQATVAVDYRGDLKVISHELARYNEVTFLAVMLGHHNVLCEISTTDESEIADFVSLVVAAAEGVRAVDVWRHLEVHKWETATRNSYSGHSTSTAAPARQLDTLDVALLRLLIDDPRRGYSDLAIAVNAPYSMVRRRCQALFEAGIIRAETVVNRVSTETSKMALLGLRLSGESVESVLSRVAAIDQVEILVRVSGPFTAIAELACSSEEELLSVDDQIRRVPGVAEVTLFPYVRIEKLPYAWTFPRPAARHLSAGGS